MQELLIILDFDDKKVPTEMNKLRNSNRLDTESIELVKMKRSSMDIMCRLVAITNQYECTDEAIQSIDLQRNTDDLLDLLKRMHTMKKSIETCQEDYQRLILIFSKLFATKYQLIPDTEVQETKPIDNEQHETVESNESVDPTTMEFFAMRGDDEYSDSDSENEEKSKRFRTDDGLDEIDLKITRSMFAPVLKQLKVKIDPIKSEMKERELKFLLAKGMEHGKILEFDENDDEIDSFSGENKPKPNRYDEMRSFLEQKQQFSFMQTNPFGLPNSCGDEDILE